MTESTTEAPARSGTPADGEARNGPRGWASLYALAFLLMVAAAATLGVAVKGFLASTTPLWMSAGLSAGSIVVAIVSLVLPRRR
ncbi:MAG: hypothetical protein M3O98_08105 [Actinomycetota bacterium]|nr:hypothetical protein [Actinomycetota bacterium]